MIHLQWGNLSDPPIFYKTFCKPKCFLALSRQYTIHLQSCSSCRHASGSSMKFQRPKQYRGLDSTTHLIGYPGRLNASDWLHWLHYYSTLLPTLAFSIVLACCPIQQNNSFGVTKIKQSPVLREARLGSTSRV